MPVTENYESITDPSLERPVIDFTLEQNLKNGYIEEFGRLFLQKLLYYSLSWEASAPTNIYNEQDSSTYHTPVRLPTNAELNPTEKELTRWGIQHPRDVIFYVGDIEFRKVDLTPQVGDQISYEGIFYKVTEVLVEDRIEASYQPQTVKLAALRTPVKEVPS